MALARIRKYQDAAGALEDESLVTLDAEREKEETPTTGADNVEEIPAADQATAKKVAAEQEVSPTKERQKYKYAGTEIDLECYIKNLRHNVSNYIDSKTSWSQQRKEAFWASFEEYMEALSDCRLSANYSGTIQDTESVLHNNPMSYVMADGSVRSREEIDSLRRRQKRFNDIFDSNGDVAYFFKWVADGQLEKEEEEAKIAEDEKRRNDEKYRKDHEYSDAKWGLQSAFNAGYNPYMERMDWEYFMQQEEKDDDGNYGIDKRCGSMAGFIRCTYLPDIEDVDFSKSKWHNRDTFLKAINTVLNDLDQNIVDKGHMIEAGFDPLFVQNFFAKNKSEIKYWDAEHNRPVGFGDDDGDGDDDDDRYLDSPTDTEEKAIKQIIQDISNIYVDNLDVESRPITDIDLKFSGKGNNVSKFATGPGNYLSQWDKSEWLEKISDIYANSGNNGYDLESALSQLGYGNKVTDASGNDIAIYLRAYFEACQANGLVAKSANETGYFRKMMGNDFKDWYVYLPSINIEDGTCLLYNPIEKKYKRIKGINVNQLKGLYNYEIFSQLILPERDSSVASHRWGGLVLYAEGGSQMVLDRGASAAREQSEEAMHTYEEKAEARAQDPNNHVFRGARNTSYNENVDFTAQDYARLGAIALDIGAIVDPELFTSVGLNLASTGINVWADIADGLSTGKVVGNALLNAGFSLVSLIPMVGSSIAGGAKITRALVSMVPKITRFLGIAISSGTLLAEGPEIIKSFNKIGKDGPENKLTMKDFKNIAMGISSILTLKGSINGIRATAAKKSWNAGNRDIEVHRVMDNKGNIKTKEELSQTSLKRLGQITSDETTLVYEIGPDGKILKDTYVIHDQEVRAAMEAARSKGPEEVARVVKEYYPSMRNKNLTVESKTEMEGREHFWQLNKPRTPHEYAVLEHAKGEVEGHSLFNQQLNRARRLYNQEAEHQIILERATPANRAKAKAAGEQRAKVAAEKEAKAAEEAAAKKATEEKKGNNEGTKKATESTTKEESKASEESTKKEGEAGGASQLDADVSSESKEKGATKAPASTAEGALEKAKSMAKADAEAKASAEQKGLGNTGAKAPAAKKAVTPKAASTAKPKTSAKEPAKEPKQSKRTMNNSEGLRPYIKVQKASDLDVDKVFTRDDPYGDRFYSSDEKLKPLAKNLFEESELNNWEWQLNDKIKNYNRAIDRAKKMHALDEDRWQKMLKGLWDDIASDVMSKMHKATLYKKSGGTVDERISRLLGRGGYVPFLQPGTSFNFTNPFLSSNIGGLPAVRASYNFGKSNSQSYTGPSSAYSIRPSQWGKNFDVSSLNTNNDKRDSDRIGSSLFEIESWKQNDAQANVNALLKDYDKAKASNDLYNYYQKWFAVNPHKDYEVFLYDYNTNIDQLRQFQNRIKKIAGKEYQGLTWKDEDGNEHQLNDEKFEEYVKTNEGTDFRGLNISGYNRLMADMFGSINGGESADWENQVLGFSDNDKGFFGSTSVTRAIPVRDNWLTYDYTPEGENKFFDLTDKKLYFTSDGHIAVEDVVSDTDEEGEEQNGDNKTIVKSPSTGADVLSNIGIQGLRRDNDPIAANIYELANLAGGIAVNNKIAKVKNPIMLHDPLEHTEWVRGNESAIQQARRAAGRYQHIASENATSDAQRNAAYQLEATEKGNEALEKGWTVDNEAIEKTRKAVIDQAKENAQNRYTVADTNRQNILAENIDRQTRLAANKAKNWESISSWLMQRESDKREADEDKRQMQEKFLPYQLKNHIYSNLEQYFGGENGWPEQDIALMRAINDRIISPNQLYRGVYNTTRPPYWSSVLYGDWSTAYQRYIQCSAAINDLQTASLAAYYGISYEKARVVANSSRPNITNTPGQNSTTDSEEEGSSEVPIEVEKFGGVLLENGGSISSVEIQKLRNKAKRMELLVKTLNMKMTDFQKSLDRAQKGASDYIKSQTGRK